MRLSSALLFATGRAFFSRARARYVLAHLAAGHPRLLSRTDATRPPPVAARAKFDPVRAQLSRRRIVALAEAELTTTPRSSTCSCGPRLSTKIATALGRVLTWRDGVSA